MYQWYKGFESDQRVLGLVRPLRHAAFERGVRGRTTPRNQLLRESTENRRGREGGEERDGQRPSRSVRQRGRKRAKELKRESVSQGREGSRQRTTSDGIDGGEGPPLRRRDTAAQGKKSSLAR